VSNRDIDYLPTAQAVNIYCEKEKLTMHERDIIYDAAWNLFLPAIKLQLEPAPERKESEE
jgi:hypothetical protein